MITEFSGPVWRILLQSRSGAPLAPARAPEGRFHHTGQFALYASLSAVGAGIAIRRYVSSEDPLRVIQKFDISEARLMDFRNRPEVSAIWQDTRAKGHPSPTWKFSDLARSTGVDGLRYSSRSRPDLSHLVLFHAPPDLIVPRGEAQLWDPHC